MKKTLFVFLLLLCLIVIVLSYIFTSRGSSPLTGFNPIFTRSLGEGMALYGLKSEDELKPVSMIAVYKDKKLIYRFSPKVPKSIDYPRPLMLENAEVVRKNDGELFIVTSWGETGADYFGTHPIVIRYEGGKFRAVSFYQGYLSSDKRIRGISWTRKDFIVTNYYNNSERAKTILTQGVSVVKNNIVQLSFYGDDRPHAEEHKIVKIRFPLFNLY